MEIQVKISAKINFGEIEILWSIIVEKGTENPRKQSHNVRVTFDACIASNLEVANHTKRPVHTSD